MKAGPLWLKLQIACGEQPAMGPGKAELLEAIQTCGLISAVGRAMGMSYRRAWGRRDEPQLRRAARADRAGRRLASLPRWAETAGFDYAHRIGGGSAFLHVDSAWRNGYNGDSSLSRYTYIRAYNLTNASLGYRLPDGIELAIFARNLLDADDIQSLTIQAGNSGLIVCTPSDPRVGGGTVRFGM